MDSTRHLCRYLRADVEGARKDFADLVQGIHQTDGEQGKPVS